MEQLKNYLNEKANQYNCKDFIENDPISIPHCFSKKEDIEIAGFFAATLAWGNRKAILKSLKQLLAWMDNTPYDFVLNASEKDLKPFDKFVYRTFNGTDCLFFIKSIRNIYEKHGGLEQAFCIAYKKNNSMQGTISDFKATFFLIEHEQRTEKHIANPLKGSAAKRINMFLRWMVRNDNNGVDFGIWKNIPTSALMIPLDVHSGRIARKLELLERKQDDWKSVELLTDNLRKFDSNDPAKYDFALFGIGVNKEF